MNILIVDPKQTVKYGVRIVDFQLRGFAKCAIDLGHNVTVVKYSEKYDMPDIDTKLFSDIDDVNAYDIAIMSTGTGGNYVGGAELKQNTAAFKLLAKFKNKIYYFFTDLYIPMEPFHKTVVDPRRKNFSCYGENPNDYKIDSVDILIHSFNLKESAKYLKFDDIKIDLVYNFPIQMSMFYTEDVEFNEYNPDTREFDLLYAAGSFRAGRRAKQMIKYFFDNGLKAAFLGKVKLDDFKNEKFIEAPTFLGKVGFDEIKKNNENSLATIIISDRNYYNHFYVTRLFEAMIADQIIFIDEAYDSNHTLFKNDFRYVSNKKQLASRIKKLRQNKDLCKELIDEQRQLYIKKYSNDVFKNKVNKFLNVVGG